MDKSQASGVGTEQGRRDARDLRDAQQRLDERNRELEQANRRAGRLTAVLRGIRNVNQLITKEDDLGRLIQGACAALTADLSYHNAWIALLDEAGRTVVAIADAGLDGAFEQTRERLSAGDFPDCMRRALERDEVIIAADPALECRGCTLSASYGGRAGLSRRLALGNRTYGVLAVSAPAAYASEMEERSLFDEVAGDLAFALHKIETAARLRESERDLRRAQALAHLGSWRFDLNSGRAIASEETRRIYGLGEAEWSIEQVQAIPLERYRQALDRELDRLIHEGAPYDIEFQIRRPSDQAVRHIHSIAEYDAERRIVFGTVQDITEQKQAQEAERQAEALNRAIIESIPGTFYMLDEHGRYARWNAYQRDVIVGKPESEVAQTFALDTIHPDDRALIQAKIESVLTTGVEQTVAGRVLLRGGPEFQWLLMTGRQMLIEGHPYLIGTGIDISGIRQREERIALLGRMLDAAPAAVTVHDTEGRFVFANSQTLSLHGYTDEAEFLSVNLHDLDVPEAEALLAERFRRIKAEGEARFETAHYRKDGSTFPLEVLAKTIEWQGRPAVLSVASDITERKRTEEELRRRDSIVQRIFEILPIGLWFADKNGALLRGNPAGVRIWGAEPHVSVGEYGIFKAWRLPSREPVQPAEWALARTLREKVTIVDELLEIESFDGKRKTILNYAAPVLDDRGNIDAAIVVNLDISDRMALESQLAQAQKMESVGRLAGGVAHDFNNLLAGIMNYVELCRDELAPDHPIRGYLDEIMQDAERSAGLTRQLLAFARRQTIAPEVLDLNDAVAGVLKMLHRLIGEDIELTWQPARVLWPVRVDPGQIDQILANLCVNARHAINGVGKVTIKTACVTTGQGHCDAPAGLAPGDYAMLTVSDDGCGMDRETLDHIFEPFFTTKPLGEGTGLGLATVHGIVMQNHGGIGVSSEIGKGTTFRIYLPRTAAAPVADPPESEATPEPPRGSETVLLVEDEKSLRVTCRLFLEGLGYTVLVAESPAAALRLAGEHHGRIDLLVTDVVMPGMSGRDLAEHLARGRAGMACLFISGYTADVIANRGVLDENLNFMAKPFSRNELARRVREILQRS